MNDPNANAGGNRSYDQWRRRHAESQRPEPRQTGVDKFAGALILGGFMVAGAIRTWWGIAIGLAVWGLGVWASDL